MKRIKAIFVPMVVLLIATVFAQSANAQTKYFERKSGADFFIGVTSSDELDDEEDYNISTSSAPSCTTPQTRLCYIKITRISGGTDLPSNSQLLAEIKRKYEEPNPDSFFEGQTWTATISGVLVEFEVHLKSTL